ncbi:MAG TPA: class I SAM-dependent methyltransferase [Bryobacteraceae bacterium]|nr:class I SAM-dependent methyltransferase [Bryobacteraceae bacterium]
MNLIHRCICGSSLWKNFLESRLVPWTLDGVSLGATVLEIGPGPGAVTSLLLPRVPHLTCVEKDRRLAKSLQRRLAVPNVSVLCEDATATSLPSESFDSAVCFTMLHHVPSPALQDRLLAETARVLRPGGIFAGADSLYNKVFGLLHIFDTMVMVDPATFPRRLEAAGFRDIEIDQMPPHAFRFRARKV